MTDIVEELDCPEEHYPEHFDTPKRANALLSYLCQEAAEEIVRLRAQLSDTEKVFGKRARLIVKLGSVFILHIKQGAGND